MLRRLSRRLQHVPPQLAIDVYLLPLGHHHGYGHEGELVVPVANDKVSLAGHGGMNGVLCQQVAELAVVGVGRCAPYDIARIDILYRIPEPQGIELVLYLLLEEDPYVLVLYIA